MSRVFESIVYGTFGLVVVLAVVLAIQISLLWGMLSLLILGAAVVVLIYNFDAWLVHRLVRTEPTLMLNLCESGFVGLVRRLVGWVPSGPRCRFCQVPFSGVGRLLHIRPSPKNPNFCQSCFEALPEEAYPMEVGVLFADLRGFTAFTESHSGVEARQKLIRFYTVAEEVLTRNDALVEFVGDQVMALFMPVMPRLRERMCEAMLDTAEDLVAAISRDSDALPVGVGLNLGVCEVGNVSKGAAKDFTAVGDTVNTAARLQGCAKNYEIVLSESVYAGAGSRIADTYLTTFELKGKSQSVRAYVVPASSAIAAA